MIDEKFRQEMKEKFGVDIPTDIESNSDAENTVAFFEIVFEQYEKQMADVLSEEERKQVHALVLESLDKIKKQTGLV